MSETEQNTSTLAEDLSLDEVDALLDKEFKPKTDYARDEVRQGVRTLAEQVLKDAGLIKGDVVNKIKAYIAEIDENLTHQVNEILHHEDFQKMESAWRGLHFLVSRTETSKDLKIRVMNISKSEIRNTLARHPGTAWDQSPLFKKIYETGYGVLGGEPVGAIVGDYHFDYSGPDVDVLQGIARIASAAHAPFISGASSDLLDLDDWKDIGKKADLATLFESPPYADWRALRESEDSRYLGLALPRFLSRRPYGKNNPVDEFDFVEDTSGEDSSKFAWSNAAYAMASNITRSFALNGWCANIRGVESGGAIQNLPTHTFPTEKGTWSEQCPTEVSITDRREGELSNLGFMPLIYKQNSNMAAFIGAQSLHAPAEYEGEGGADATKNAKLGARLPYLFACSRFAHYLKCIVRDKVGSFKEREDMQKWLGSWIQNYVESDPNAAEPQKAARPLSAAEVSVESDPENPGYYSARFYLRPHYQLEGVDIALSLVSRLPSEQA